MTEKTDLLNALDYIRPSELDYKEWAEIGMAIKQAGLPCSVWDAWSMKDPARYHDGECKKKWESFRGHDQPITENTIFKMAIDRGWSGGTGHELDWNDQISGDEILIDKNWIEDRTIDIPEEWYPEKQLITYLEALFEPTENVGYVTKSWCKEGRYLPTQGYWDRTAGQLIEELAACGGEIEKVVGDYDPAAGAWIRFNPLDGNGCKNDNVTEYRFALIESDQLELEKQNAIIHQLELPCAALVYSGGKSLHAIVHIDAPDYAEYRKRVDYLYSVCQKNGLALDQACRNPSRLSRMPGATRNGQKQYLMETNFGKTNWEEWREWIDNATDDLPDTENMADMWNNIPPLADALIDGVLRQGHKMLLAGPSKAGKSFALIELCISIAEKKQWLGRWSCAQGKVLYINLELDRASCLHRFKDVYEALGIPAENLKNIDIWNLRGASVPMDKLSPKLIRRASKKGYIAVVIDPIYKVITGDENSAEQMAKFCNQFDFVCRELGCAVIYCHHHSKGAQGGKRSMDRASGSGVFARDPDAMLDMTELDLTDAIRAQLENKAACAECCRLLDKRGHHDAYGQDDALSKTQMISICREHLSSADLRMLDVEIEKAKKKALSQTAWRIEGTLREFARFDPVNLWFDYPVHRLDGGMLEDLQPETDAKITGRYGAKKRWNGSKEDRSKQNKEQLSNAFEASLENGQVTIYAMAEYLDLKPDTVRRRLKVDGGYWIEDGKVGRKSLPPNGSF